MIDRRQFVTGVASVVVAGVTPALPASAAPLIRTGLVFRRGEYARGWSEAIVQTAFGDRWHFQKWGYHERTLCHCATRLMFATELRRTDGVELIWRADAPPFTIDDSDLDTIGHAARLTSGLAGMAGWHRENDEGREGAFFYWHRDGLAAQTITEDAPPLPRFGY